MLAHEHRIRLGISELSRRFPQLENRLEVSSEHYPTCLFNVIGAHCTCVPAIYLHAVGRRWHIDTDGSLHCES